MLISDAEQLNEEGAMYLCAPSVLSYHFGVYRFYFSAFCFALSTLLLFILFTFVLLFYEASVF